MANKALVVGVNSWENPTAVDDARAVAQLLESRGFEVRTINGARATCSFVVSTTFFPTASNSVNV